MCVCEWLEDENMCDKCSIGLIGCDTRKRMNTCDEELRWEPHNDVLRRLT